MLLIVLYLGGRRLTSSHNLISLFHRQPLPSISHSSLVRCWLSERQYDFFPFASILSFYLDMIYFSLQASSFVFLTLFFYQSFVLSNNLQQSYSLNLHHIIGGKRYRGGCCNCNTIQKMKKYNQITYE